MITEKTGTQVLVDGLMARGFLQDVQVQAAFQEVPRHVFMPGIPLEKVYSDQSVPCLFDDDGQALCSATMPSMIAYMLAQLDLAPGQNVLEIGTGTGYTAALMRHILGNSGKITSLEIDRTVVEMAQDNLLRASVSDSLVVHVDGADGYAPRAAYDRIIATTGIWDVPVEWINQLKPGGRIVAPLWLDGLQVSAAFTVQADGTLYAGHMMPSAFVYIRGRAAGPRMRKRIGSAAISLFADDVDQIDAISLATLLSEDHEAVQLGKPLDTAAYWYGFLPYLMLNEPDEDIFALYRVEDGRTAYGIEGEGFVLLTPASACFVPYYGLGFAHNFAGSDAFLEVESYLKRWEAAGHPGIDRLRLRLVPKAQGKPQTKGGKVYERRDHYLVAWMQMDDADDVGTTEDEITSDDAHSSD